jgi:hypothetical protein
MFALLANDETSRLGPPRHQIPAISQKILAGVFSPARLPRIRLRLHYNTRLGAASRWAIRASPAMCRQRQVSRRKRRNLFRETVPLLFHKVGFGPLDGVCSTDNLVLAPKSLDWFGFLLAHSSCSEPIPFADLASAEA